MNPSPANPTDIHGLVVESPAHPGRYLAVGFALPEEHTGLGFAITPATVAEVVKKARVQGWPDPRRPWHRLWRDGELVGVRESAAQHGVAADDTFPRFAQVAIASVLLPAIWGVHLLWIRFPVWIAWLAASWRTSERSAMRSTSCIAAGLSAGSARTERVILIVMAQPLPMPPPGFDELPVEEKIDYVQALWDRIAANAERSRRRAGVSIRRHFG
jgi:hypothetical protein